MWGNYHPPMLITHAKIWKIIGFLSLTNFCFFSDFFLSLFLTSTRAFNNRNKKMKEYRVFIYSIVVNFLMFKLVLEKAEEPEIKLPTSAGSRKKQESSRKTSIFALLTMPKPLTEWITINCGKFWKRWEYQTTWPASWEICMQVRKQQLELDVEQQTGSK